jgi:chromosome segregation ATPase
LNKTSYSEDEVKKLLQNLYFEKKKVQELKSQVKTLSDEESSLRKQIASNVENAVVSKEAISLRDPILLDKLDTLQARSQQEMKTDADAASLLNEELQSVQNALEMQEETVSVLKAQIEEQEQSQTLDAEQLRKLKILVVAMKKKLNAVGKRDCPETLEKLEDLTREAEALNKSKSILLKEKERAHQEIEDLHLSLKEQREELQKHIDTAIHAGNQKDTVEKQSQEYRISLEAVRAELAVIEEQLHESKMGSERQSNEYTEKVSELFQKLEIARKGVEGMGELNSRIEELSESLELTEKEKKTAEENFSRTKLQMDKLNLAQKSKIEELQVLISQLRIQLNGTQEEQAKRMEEIISSQSDRVTVAEEKMTELKGCLDDAEQKCQHWEQRHNLVEEQVKVLKEKNLQNCQRLESLQRELDTAEEKLTENEEQLRKFLKDQPQLSKEKEDLQRQTVIAEARLGEVKTLLTQSNEQQQRQKIQNDRLVTIIKDKDQRILDLKHFEHSYKKAVLQSQDLEQNLHQERKYIHDLDTKVQDTTEHLADKELEILQLQENLDLLTQQYDESSQFVTQLKEMHHTSTVEGKQLNTQLDTQKTRLTSLEKEQEELLTKHEKSCEDYEKQISVLKANLLERTDTLQEMNKELNLIKQTLVRGIRESKEIESLYHNAAGEKAAALANLQKAKEENHRQDKELETWKQRASEAIQSNKTTQARCDFLEQSIDTVKVQTIAIQDHKKKLDLEVENLNKRLEEAKEEQLNSFMETQSSQESIAVLSTSIENLEHTIECLKNEKSELVQARDTDHALTRALNEKLESLEKNSEEKLSAVALEEEKTKSMLEDKMQLQEKYELLKEEYNDAAQQIDEAIEASNELQERYDELSSIHQQTLEHVSEKDTQLKQFHQENENLQSDRTKGEELSKEQTVRTKELQHHLHNKVKEATLVNEKLEEYKAALHEAQNTINTQQSKILDLSELSKEQRKKEDRLEKLLNESIKSAESQVSKWEEKYLNIHEKSQNYESEIKEFKKQEDKYRHVEKLLANLGNLITEPLGATAAINATQQLAEMVQPSNAPKNVEEAPPPQEPTRSLGDLFDTTHANPKVKETLF